MLIVSPFVSTKYLSLQGLTANMVDQISPAVLKTTELPVKLRADVLRRKKRWLLKYKQSSEPS